MLPIGCVQVAPRTKMAAVPPASSPVPEHETTKNSDGQTPESSTVHVLRAAASAAALHSAWLLLPPVSPLSSFQLRLDSAGPGLSSLLSSTGCCSHHCCFPSLRLGTASGGTRRGWAAVAEDRVCRDDPGSIPAGEREAKPHFWGCAHLLFALKPHPPVMMCMV